VKAIGGIATSLMASIDWRLMMKDPWDWEYDDVQQLVDDCVRESATLEYKACNALRPQGDITIEEIKDEISRDISAFANAGGGTIIYGVREYRDRHLPEGIDDGFAPEERVDHQWLEQVINTRIGPKIPDVRIKPITIPGSSNIIIVVYVPRSYVGPHQAADGRFYQRHNFERRVMEWHQIEDVRNRAQGPLLSLGFSIHRAVEPDISPDEMPYEGAQCELEVTVENLSPQPAMYAIATVELPWPWVYLKPSALYNIAGPSDEWMPLLLPDGRRLANSTRIQEIWSSTVMQLHGHPIFKGRTFDFFALDVLAPDRIDELPIHWTIEAPHMLAASGWAFIAPRSRKVEINPDRLDNRIELWIEDLQGDPKLLDHMLSPNIIQLPGPIEQMDLSLSHIPPWPF
jgi:hypothetical protein